MARQGNSNTSVGSAGRGGRASVGYAAQPKRSKSGKRKFLWFLLVLAVLAPVGYFAGPPAYREIFVAPIENPDKPTFIKDDGKVKLKVPPLGMDDGTTVDFDYEPKSAGSMDKGQLPFKTISTPVNIYTNSGALKPDRVAVTIEYDPSRIPKDLTSNQVGMAVYDTTLGTWVPILNAKADAETNTVTAIAPHFSVFAAFVLDPLENVVKIAGQAIETAINASISVQSWFNGLVNEVAGNLVKNLFGQVDPLKCEPASKRIEASATDSYNALTVCTKPANNNDRLYIGNGYAFPLLTDELPAGVKLEADDLGFNGEDLTAMIRSAYWAGQNKAYFSGTSHSSVTVTGDMKQNASISMELDDEAVAFDIGLAVLTVLAPPSAAAKAGVKAGASALLKGADIATLASDGAAWFNQAYNLLDCITSTVHDSFEKKLGMEPVDQMFTKEGYKDAADLAYGCLATILEKLNLKGALAELLNSVKVIPEVLSSAAYVTAGALLESLPSQFDSIKQKPLSVTVTRVEATPKQNTKPKATPKKPAPTADSDVARFVGRWRAANASVVVNKDGTGHYSVNGFCLPDDPMLGDFQACSVKIPVTYVSANNGGGVYGTYGKPVARSARDGQNNKIVQLAPADKERFEGKRFELTASTNERIVAVTSETGVVNWLCDNTAHRIAQDARYTGGRYREQCNKPIQ